MALRVAVAPDFVTNVVHGKLGAGEERRRRIEVAVSDVGAELVDPSDADALVWLEVGDAAPLIEILDANPNISWVQLSWAGVDPLLGSGLFQRDVMFTCAKGVFGQETAEHALALILGCLRHHVPQARTPRWNWIENRSLFDKRVTILGGGDTATNLVELLRPFRCEIRVLRRSPEPIAGVFETATLESLSSVLPVTDILVLALSLTDETRGVIGAEELALLADEAVVVNVARGAHIDTEALVAALSTRRLSAAGLDVTNPEPLPEGHPLWQLDNVLVASHSANGVDFSTEVLAQRVAENIRRRTNDETLIGVVDLTAGY